MSPFLLGHEACDDVTAQQCQGQIRQIKNQLFFANAYKLSLLIPVFDDRKEQYQLYKIQSLVSEEGIHFIATVFSCNVTQIASQLFNILSGLLHGSHARKKLSAIVYTTQAFKLNISLTRPIRKKCILKDL